MKDVFEVVYGIWLLLVLIVNLVAKLFNFESRDFFNVDPAVRAAPSIQGSL